MFADLVWGTSRLNLLHTHPLDNLVWDFSQNLFCQHLLVPDLTWTHELPQLDKLNDVSDCDHVSRAKESLVAIEGFHR